MTSVVLVFAVVLEGKGQASPPSARPSLAGVGILELQKHLQADRRVDKRNDCAPESFPRIRDPFDLTREPRWQAAHLSPFQNGTRLARVSGVCLDLPETLHDTRFAVQFDSLRPKTRLRPAESRRKGVRMKKSLILAAVLVVVTASGAAMAADTATVTVTASVTGTCRFMAPKTGAVAFGALDPGNAVAVVGTVTQPQFWCTKGASYTITDDLGLHESGTTFRMQHATDNTEFIPYTFTYTTAGTGNGPASPFTMDIAATIPAGTYAGSLAGAYGDTVTLTVNP